MELESSYRVNSATYSGNSSTWTATLAPHWHAYTGRKSFGNCSIVSNSATPWHWFRAHGTLAGLFIADVSQIDHGSATVKAPLLSFKPEHPQNLIRFRLLDRR
jgi:hypothetical protein